MRTFTPKTWWTRSSRVCTLRGRNSACWLICSTTPSKTVWLEMNRRELPLFGRAGRGQFRFPGCRCGRRFDHVRGAWRPECWEQSGRRGARRELPRLRPSRSEYLALAETGFIVSEGCLRGGRRLPGGCRVQVSLEWPASGDNGPQPRRFLRGDNRECSSSSLCCEFCCCANAIFQLASAVSRCCLETRSFSARAS